MALQPLQGHATVVPHIRMIWFQRNGLIEARQRLAEAIELQQGIAPVVPGFGIAGLERECGIETRKSLRVAFQPHQHHAPKKQRFKKLGIQRQRLVETNERFFLAMQILEHASTAIQSFERTRIDPDGLADQALGLLELPILELDESEQTERVEILGLGAEKLPAEPRGFGAVACLVRPQRALEQEVVHEAIGATANFAKLAVPQSVARAQRQARLSSADENQAEAAMLLISNDDVKKVLDMGSTLAALEGVYQEMTIGDAVGMGRIDVYVPSDKPVAPYYRWAVMTGGSRKDGFVCARMLSDMVNWPRQHGHVRETKYAGAPGTFCGLLFLFSIEDATPVAMINDGHLQHLRVGGSAGLGAKYLSRADSSVVGMIGSGGMARTYLDAFCRVRSIRKVKVYSPNRENLQIYAREMAKTHAIEVVPTASARQAVQAADIVSICTSSNEPVFMNAWLEPGQHVTNLTSADIEPGLVRAVDVAVRAGEATPRLAELSEQTFYARAGFLSYVAGTAKERASVPHVNLSDDVICMPRLVDVVAGTHKGRSDARQTTLFLNVGAIGTQFEAVAATVYRRAREQGLGREIPTEWFLQDVRD